MQPHTNPYTAMAGSLHDPIIKIMSTCRIRIRVHIRTYGNTTYIFSHRDFCRTRIHIRTNGNVALLTDRVQTGE